METRMVPSRGSEASRAPAARTMGVGRTDAGVRGRKVECRDDECWDERPNSRTTNAETRDRMPGRRA